MTTRRKMPLTKWRPTRWPRDSAAWPRRVAPGLFSEPGTASLPRPVSTATAKSPRRRLQPGGDGAGAQRPCARDCDRRPLARARFRWRPAAVGGACGATPRLAAAGCAKACRPRRWQFAACYVTKDGSPTRRPASLMELPRHASSTSPQTAARGVLACRWGVGLSRVRARAGEAVARGCRVGHVSFRDRRPVRPWFVVNPGEGTASPWASWPQPSSENNFPAAARLPRAANSFRFQVLHAAATAARCGPPIPRRPDHNKDALARPCSTRKEKHHG